MSFIIVIEVGREDAAGWLVPAMLLAEMQPPLSSGDGANMRKTKAVGFYLGETSLSF
jgi:hypothetical protein